MKHSLTEYKNNRSSLNRKDIFRLQSIYRSLPETDCTREDCRKWCCTKTETSITPSGKFSSLPLVYSVEYWNIDRYLRSTLSEKDASGYYQTERNNRLCLFFDESRNRCSIYEARPLSCRLYGMELPPLLWGIRMQEAKIKFVHCENLKVVDKEKYRKFCEAYTEYWDIMAILSAKNPVLSNDTQKFVEETTGLSNLLLFGWVEFNLLRFSDENWYRNKFRSFWEDYARHL